LSTKVLPSEWPHSADETQPALDGPLARIHTLSNAIEAHVLHDVLRGEGIQHIVQSYRDTAYDGLFQQSYGWGCIITREEDVSRAVPVIKAALEHFEDDN